MADTNENNMSRLVITLTLIGIISALLLSFVFQWTDPYIKGHQEENREEAIYGVLPGADRYETVEKEGLEFFEGFSKNGQKVGVAVLVSGSGFQGEIEVMVGTDPEAEKIYHIKILEHQETPGLGARITESGFRDNFVDKPFGNYDIVQEADDPLEVEGISGATISSKNVTEIVEKAVEDIQNIYGGGSK
ncbi:MAG: RnfABCDGE type electron transport complex subunit G [Bacillota bacterium]